MTDYNKKQAKLVIDGEKPLRFRITHRDILGRIPQMLLLKFLKDELEKEFSGIYLNEGFVAGQKDNGQTTQKALSRTYDIIAYKDDPIECFHDYVIVAKEQVLWVMEVKKEVTLSSLNLDQIHELTASNEFYFYLVGLRTTNEKQVDKIKNKKTKFKTFLFAIKKKTYPAKEYSNDWLIPGQLEDLVNEIKTTLKSHSK